MNPLLVEHNILTLLTTLGLVGGFIRIMVLDMRLLVTSDLDIALTLGLLLLLVVFSRSWQLVPDMLGGTACIGMIVLGIKLWYGRRFGSGDCLVYPLCGFATGFSAMTSWLLSLTIMLLVFPLAWAIWRGKAIWPPQRLQRMIFPGTPPAILAVFLTWGKELLVYS